jgi:rhodanese-related sulfurtransferase/DNA-directed RNA polymerase subunit RPC12/RpoP
MLQNILLLLLVSFLRPSAPPDKYQCMPCGSDCDKAVYTAKGRCTECHMELVKRGTVVFKQVPATAVCDYISSHPGIVLLDVRTRDEFMGKADPYFGGLKNSINIPIQELEKRVNELDKYKGKEILVFCSHSHRSPRASYFLTQHGFSKVTNMSGGMSVLKSGPCKN